MATQIRVELELADGTFTQRMIRAGQTVEQLNRQIVALNPGLERFARTGQSAIRSVDLLDRQSKGFLSTMRDLAIVTGVVGMGISKLTNIQSTWLGSLIKTNTEFERLLFQMRSMSQAADPVKDAANSIDFLRKQAMQMPFSMGAINQAFVKLKATGTDPLNGSLKALADGVAAFGGSDEALERVTLGISQMSGKGVIQMEELRQQLGEQMPTAVALMAQSMGVSMGHLIKQISTGTVSSKQALQAFYSELERSHGGAAQAMMQTFGGQVKQTTMLFQNLALVAGGVDDATKNYAEGGFMDVLRDQLREVNSLLSSEIGTNMAQMLGSGLAQGATYLRSFLGTVVELREEIVRFAMIAGGAFLLKSAIGGLGAFRVALQGARLGLVGFGTQMALADRQLTVFSRSLRDRRPGRADQAGFAMLGNVVGAAGVAFGALAPWLPIVGLGIFAVAEYFDIFNSKGTDAIRTLKDFGASSKDVLDVASDYVAKQEKEFTDLTATRERFIKNSVTNSLPKLRAWKDSTSVEEARRKIAAEAAAEFDAENDYNTKREEIQANRLLIQKRGDELTDRQNKEAVQKLRDDLQEKNNVLQNDYRTGARKIQEDFDKKLGELPKGRSGEAVEKERAKELLKNAQSYYDQRTQIIEEGLRIERDALKNSTDEQRKAQAATFIRDLEEQKNQVYEGRRLAEQQILAGIQHVVQPLDSDKSLEKGNEHLARIKGEVAGLKGELTGASGEVEKLKQLLSQPGVYGDDSLESVKQLKSELIAAQVEKEILDELMKGKNKLDNDVERARMSAIEKEMELKERAMGRELSESEKVRLRMESGYYAGFGPASQTQQFLMNLLKTFDAQGSSLNQIADVLQNNAFGAPTLTKINTVADALMRVAGQINGIGAGLNGLNWQNFNMPGDGFLPGGDMRNVQFAGKGILDLIAKVESGGNYNSTLDNGRWTNGPRNIVGMSLNQVREMQKGMLSHAENRAKYGNGLGSSAVGRYQIVGKTLEGLMKEMGLSGNELFDEKMQDAMASRLLARRQGQGVEGLRNEWEGLRGVPAAQIQAALSQGAVSPTAPVAPAGPVYTPSAATVELEKELNRLRDEAISKLEQTAALEKKNEAGEKTQDAVDRKKEMVAALDAEKEALTDLDSKQKNYLATRKFLEKKNIDLGSKEAKEALQAAKDLDAFQTQAADKRKTHGEINSAEEKFAQRRIELARQTEEAYARMTDPLEKKSSSTFRELERQFDEYLRNIEQHYSRDSDQYRQALTDKQAMLRSQNAAEAAEYFAKLSKTTIDTKRSLMSESQQRASAMQEQLAEIDRWVERARKAGLDEVEITRKSEEAKAAIRGQYAQQVNPMSKQMQEWGDLQGNLAQASTQWMDSLADGISGLLTGTGDLKSMVTGMANDMIKMLVKYAMSGVMGNKSGAPAGGNKMGKAASAAGTAATGGKSKLGSAIVGVNHAGGIIGSRSPGYRRANMSAFVGAPRFHTGGIIGSDEVPIIAQKGEGVFTAEQMKHLGGGSNIQIHAPVTVNASGGTPAQNDDLAKKMGREMESTMRGMVASELQKQMRPGNMLNNKGR